MFINPPKEKTAPLEKGSSQRKPRDEASLGDAEGQEPQTGPFQRQGPPPLSARPGPETPMGCCAWVLTALGCEQPPGQLGLRSWLQRPVALPSWRNFPYAMRCGLKTNLSHVIISLLFKVGGFVGWCWDEDNYLAGKPEVTSSLAVRRPGRVCLKQVWPSAAPEMCPEPPQGQTDGRPCALSLCNSVV